MNNITHHQKYHTSDHSKKLAHYRHIKACFGLSKQEYDTLFESQGGVCAICGCDPNQQLNIKGTPMKKRNLSVDHEHTSADWERGTKDKTTIRGLLCVNCNQALGGFKDSIEILQKAISYLQKPRPILHSSTE